ncbi:hypothetical protein PSCLAVI8L_130323 [Pseudoclavibacter sp. 8L]|nr:hypothetical protein PSCLAVI8L_130323 [Pseudoclavibacter sp. 8L]
MGVDPLRPPPLHARSRLPQLFQHCGTREGGITGSTLSEVRTRVSGIHPDGQRALDERIVSPLKRLDPVWGESSQTEARHRARPTERCPEVPAAELRRRDRRRAFASLLEGADGPSEERRTRSAGACGERQESLSNSTAQAPVGQCEAPVRCPRTERVRLADTGYSSGGPIASDVTRRAANGCCESTTTVAQVCSGERNDQLPQSRGSFGRTGSDRDIVHRCRFRCLENASFAWVRM